MLVPWPGIKPIPPAVDAWSPNHWTVREVLQYHFLIHLQITLFLFLSFQKKEKEEEEDKEKDKDKKEEEEEKKEKEETFKTLIFFSKQKMEVLNAHKIYHFQLTFIVLNTNAKIQFPRSLSSVMLLKSP